MTALLDKLRWSLHHRGLGGTVQAGTKSLSRKIRPESIPPPHPFDLAHGTETGGLITGADLASGHPSDRHIAGYAAVPPSRFRNILTRWQASNPPHPIGDYTFIDLGCGKGRAVLLASEHAFREVIGVELNPSLAAIARANADRWIAAGRPNCVIRIERGDATAIAWPSGPCAVFLFNPFGPALMQRLADRLTAEFRDRPSDLEIIYYKPEQAEAFAKSFEITWRDAIPISPEDLAADPVASPADETCAYRLR